ncbi:MAG: NfeD family protein [Nitrospirota bacterium]
MTEVLSELTNLEKFFLICAFLGGVIFLIRFLIQLAGGDADVDTDIDVGHADMVHGDVDASFKILTLQGLTAFFMMFGLVGFVLLRESKVGNAVAIGGATIAGLASVWIIGKIFSSFTSLQSSGTVENKSAVGSEGTVYLTIHAGGTGKVQVSVKGRLREFDAVSEINEDIPTGSRIKVKDINGRILVVEKI